MSRLPRNSRPSSGDLPFFWATATWWIPLLVLIGFWRHVWKAHPVRYEPEHWSMVFPLAMYTAATYQLGSADELRFLRVIPKLFVFIALLAWLLVFVGFLRAIVRSIQNAP